MDEAYDEFEKIRGLIRRHHRVFRRSIPLIASENVTSPAVREVLISDFSHRYAEGWPGERVYAGCKYIDEVELICQNLMKKLFRVEFADVRPTSGVSANLVIYTAFTKPGDTMMSLSITSGGHITMGPYTSSKTGAFIGGTAGAVHGLRVEYLPFDEREMNIDVDRAIKEIKRIKPKLLLFGGSVLLFPHPVRELSEVAKEAGSRVAYDAAHVAGLIASGHFQDPMREGADAMSMSTHKTLPGPQHGAVVARKKYGEEIKKATFPSVTSNHHLHNVAGLAVALVELSKFGEKYTGQIIKNAKALGQALHERGFGVVAEHKGFTESHTLLVDITGLKDTVGLGGDVERLLEKAGIILNRNLLPWDIRESRHFENPGGVRLGTSEVTHLGMKGGEMTRIAELMKRVLIDREKPEKVAEDVAELRRDYQKVHYCFDSHREAYEYIKIH